tara:strand:- start:1483 stop:1635 length:153 start_codon:yes stop_codon:yes gene_type:complete
VKVGDLVIWPNNGVIIAEDTDEDNGEKMYKVIFCDGCEEWFYDGYCEVAK